ncbi:MAG: HAD family phosphatase [Eggerthellaceae bacterium]|nr:HAD family phosphatase [Eggerthellaceae bacterium]
MRSEFATATGFIFDCDGTLLDSMPAWNETEARLADMCREPLTAQDVEDVRALPITQAAAIFAAHGVAPTADEVLALIDDMLLSFYGTKVQARPGALAFVQELARVGVPCTVVSSSPARYIDAGLSHNGFDGLFREVVSTDTVKLSKQDPRIYRYAIDRMGSRLETTWGVDDALYAVKVMRDTGLRTVGAYDCDETAGSVEELAAATDICVLTLEDLLS